jgi:hypothetical protein
LAKE